MAENARSVAWLVAIIGGTLVLITAVFVWAPWWLRDVVIAIGCLSTFRDLRRWWERRHPA